MGTLINRHIAFTLLLGLAVLLAGCGQDQITVPGSDGQPARVTFALDYTPNTNHTGIYVAQQKGWYKEAGLDLRILPYAEGTTTDLLVSSGKADFGISYEESVVLARAAGQDIVSTAAVLPTNTSALVTLKESGLDSPKKLDGKRYAGFGAPFEEPVISTVIKHDGGEGKFKNVTANLYGFEAVKAGEADFVWIFMGWDGVAAERAGLDLNTFYIKEHGVPDYYTPVIITSGKKIREDPETVRRFMEATARGYEWAVEHPDEAADLLIKGAPEGTFTDPEFVKASQRWLSPRYKEGQDKWGTQELEVWTEYPRFMYRTGKVTDASGKAVRQEPDYKSYFTTEFLP
ncbi:MAG: ABC transporter substrate-binding protein [Chloroflexota bacterium]|nr:ABC transporter substrate-binding protein [Chloroflexota bacterium]